MRKSTLFLIIFVFGIYFMIIFSSLYEEGELPNPFDYARITDVDYKAVLVDEPNSKGKVVVTERLTFDIHAASANNPFWELWRDLPESYVDGVKVYYKVNSVKQISRKGKEIVYDESPKLYWYDSDYTNTARGYGPGKWYHSEGPYNEDFDRYECVFFYINGVYREEMVFEIEYEIYNAALRYKDCSELFLSLFSEDSVKYLKSFKAQILIPENDMPSKDNYEAHTYGTNSHEFDFKESTTKNPGYHTFYFNLDEDDLQFKPHNEYIEFTLISFGDDKHKFTDYASRNTYYNYNVLDELREEQENYETIPEKAKKNKTIVLIICSAASVLLVIYTIRKDKNIRKKFNFYKPTMESIFYRDIPSNLDPNFAAELVFCKHKKKNDEANGYSAIMLSLIRKGYIELEKIDATRGWNSSNVKIIIKKKRKPIINSIPSIRVTQPVNPTNPVQPIIPSSGDNPIKSEDYNIQVFSSPIQNTEPVKQEYLVDKLLEGNQTDATSENTEEVTLEPLTPSEQYYFDLIIRHSLGVDITLKKFQSNVSSDYENTDTFVKKMKKSIVDIGINKGYFQKASYDYPRKSVRSQANFFTILGLVFIIVVNLILYQTTLDLAFGAFFILGCTFILSSIYLKKISTKYILLTQIGEDEYAKWRGLYNFLNSETLIKERTVIELPLWEQYLVYATAFGISDKVISALKIRCPEMEQSPMLSNPYYRSKSFYINSGRSFRSITHSASSTARSSGGYSSHGSYGGGGRGGGGGGGGH